jgi:hypothetical protein
MKLTPFRFVPMPSCWYSSFAYYTKIFVVFIAACFGFMYATSHDYSYFRPKTEKGDRIIAIPMSTDSSYWGSQLHRPLPFNYAPDDSVSYQVKKTSTYLHIKGDSCWLEHVIWGDIHIKTVYGTSIDTLFTMKEEADDHKYLITDTLELRP